VIVAMPPANPPHDAAHPNKARLLVEVADTSLPQNRLSKSRI